MNNARCYRIFDKVFPTIEAVGEWVSSNFLIDVSTNIDFTSFEEIAKHSLCRDIENFIVELENFLASQHNDDG